MPRPCKYDNPMTPAERAKEYRARKYDRQRVAMRDPGNATVPALLDELRECVRGRQPDAARDVADELVRRAGE